ncbi:MAG: hypothetical protein ACXWV2_04035, partial [Chitinophagaceae bacterium]
NQCFKSFFWHKRIVSSQKLDFILTFHKPLLTRNKGYSHAFGSKKTFFSKEKHATNDSKHTYEEISSYELLPVRWQTYSNGILPNRLYYK